MAPQDISFRKRFTRSYLSKVSRNPADRSPFVTGADAVLTPQGDLLVNSSGDIAVHTGDRCIITGLLRRLGTPPSGYARFVTTHQGLIKVDAPYFDEIYDYLSGPLTTDNLAKMRAALQQAAQKDGRVVITDVVAGAYQYATNKTELSITYRIKSETQLSVLKLYV